MSTELRVNRSFKLSKQNNRVFEAQMRRRGIDNASEYVRLLIDEEDQRITAQRSVFAALDAISVRRRVTPRDVQAIIGALARDER